MNSLFPWGFEKGLGSNSEETLKNGGFSYMSQQSPRLSLPFLQPAQSQKHVTHNEALKYLDALAQITVLGFGATTPPGNPDNGDCHAIGVSATGDWAGQDGTLAVWFDNAWSFHLPRAGWLAAQAGTRDVMVHDGTDWVPATADMDLDNRDGVGINATHDATNRLSVSAPATLLNHEGAGHQLKINKSAPGETASLLFQSDWSGRAEMGLAGNDIFSIKVSADGATWDEVLTLGAGTGVVTTDTMVGPVAPTPGPDSAVIETGSGANGSYTKFADGTLICEISAMATANGAPTTWTLPESFVNTAYSVSVTVVGASPAIATISAQSAGSVDVESFDVTGNDNVTPTVTLIAIGRWL